MYFRSEYPNFHLLICGDFNLPNIDWLNNNLSADFAVRENTAIHIVTSANSLNYYVNYCNLYQLNTVYNVIGSSLDLIFYTADYLFVTPSHDSLVENFDIYHPPLDFSYPIHLSKQTCTHYYKKDFYNADYIAINTYLNSINWNDLLSDDDVNIYDNDNFPPWINSYIKRKIILKKIVHANYKRSNTERDRLSFVKLRDECKKLCRDAQKRYRDEVESTLNRNPKYFWKYVRNLKDTNSLPNALHLNNVQASNPDDISQLFSDHFRSVYSPPLQPNQLPDLPDLPSIGLNHIDIDTSEIIDCLLQLDSSGGSGPDQIPYHFLTSCTFSIVKPLYKIFLNSLSSGVFPDLWKIGRVKPIHKSNDKTDITNYRPISILNALGKVFEKIVTTKLASALQPVLTEHQHGFVPNKSTVTNLAIISHYILQTVEKRN